MAAENAIPTIDLTALRTGSDAEQARGGAPDRRSLPGHRLLHGDRPRRPGRPHHHGAAARDRLLRAARRGEDEGAAAAGQDQPRLQLGRRSRHRLFDGTGDAARHPGGVRHSARTAPTWHRKVDKASAQMYAPNIWPRAPARFQADHGDLLRRHDGARVARAARHGDGARRRRELFRRQVRPPGERVPHHPLSGGEASRRCRASFAPAPTPTTAS